MGPETAARIVRLYGYSPVNFLGTERGYRNEAHPFVASDGRRLNLLIYKREPDIVPTIRRANRTGDYLAQSGLPARATADLRIMQLHASTADRYAALYDYLSGNTIAWETYTQEHIKLLGAMMSTMHHALKELRADNYPLVSEQFVAIYQRILRYVGDPGVSEAMLRKLQLRVAVIPLQRQQQLLQRCKTLPGQQVLHMDFVRSNILFETPKLDSTNEMRISGILDFEKTAYGHPLFDIARTLAFLLVDCKYKTDRQVRKYFLYSGYTKRGPNALPSVWIKNQRGRLSLLEQLVYVFLFHDFYKFLRHNPYESLLSNEHFIRTRDLLLNHGLLFSL